MDERAEPQVRLDVGGYPLFEKFPRPHLLAANSLELAAENLRRVQIEVLLQTRFGLENSSLGLIPSCKLLTNSTDCDVAIGVVFLSV